MLSRWLLILAFPAFAGAMADERGRAVFEAEYAASHGYGGFAATVSMTLTAKNGRVVERALRLKQMEGEEAIKTLIVFDAPSSIRGTGLLTFSRPLVDDEQWLFLPAIKRVKKVASRDRSGPFVGSEFAYEDLADHAVDAFSYVWLHEEACGELLCDVVERTPVDPYSGYSRQVVAVDRVHHRVRSIRYFDEQNVHFKTLTASDFRAYEVGERTLLQPHVLLMRNLLKGRTTRLEWERYDYEVTLVESRDFTTNALRRVR